MQKAQTTESYAVLLDPLRSNALHGQLLRSKHVAAEELLEIRKLSYALSLTEESRAVVRFGALKPRDRANASRASEQIARFRDSEQWTLDAGVGQKNYWDLGAATGYKQLNIGLEACRGAGFWINSKWVSLRVSHEKG
jgi:hypothetical protein